MAYTTTELITGAYYAAGIVSREFETTSGTQQADGLIWLNNIITETNVADGMIPYETTYNFNAVVGQEKYFVPGLVGIDTLVFYLDTVRFSMQYEKRNNYFGSPRVENINSLPFNWYFERCLGGGNIYIYFKPDQAYPIEIHGYFELASVSVGQDLSSTVNHADLGASTLYSTGILNEGQLVVNNIDLAGTYSTIGALVNYVNTGVIPSVTASLDVNKFVLSSITNPPVPIYVQTSGLAGGVSTKGLARVASTANLTATYNNGSSGFGATLTNAGAMAAINIDGVALSLGDRVLIKNQTSAIQNGIYLVTLVGTGFVNWILTRTANFDSADKIQPGNIVTITAGTTQSGTTWYQTDVVTVMGTSPIEFILFSAITFADFNTVSVPLYKVFNQPGFDEFYITYLRYALADRICSEYNEVTPGGVTKQLEMYRGMINKESKILDLSIHKLSTLTRRNQSFSWQYINLGKGWVPN